ncbi:dihydrodipicolinate synthase family protein [Mycetocola sp.]|uniref:dihydrodipicolinate synthase family protein n=1 Tax=Mycetocola sp. TaxID=1871042 RepID=UPI0026228F23|nr:dihydrodipicolinate synthase family protein [Mycetocola sp.]MCU1561281.1 dihydrodipicolinate synthase family protein [Mycetocola sp.]
MSNTIRRDILTAVPVSFTAEGEVDFGGSREILEFVRDSGVDGAFVLGTTGEFASLSREERDGLTRLSLAVLSDLPVVVHVGAPSLFEVRNLIADAVRSGATTIAVLTPYYLPASEAAVMRFYEAVAEASSGLRVFVYLFEARTGIRVSPDMLGRIAQLPNIVGAKLSGESLESVSAYRAAVPESFELFTGADRDLASAADHGAQGVVSGIASVFPRPFLDLVAALESGDRSRIEKTQSAVNDVVDTVIGDPARMKAGLRLQGVNAGFSRMALDEPDEDIAAELARAVRTYAGAPAA